MTKLRKTAAPSGGGFTPVAFLGFPCRREDGMSFKKKRSPRRIFRQDAMGRAATVRHSTIWASFFHSIPGNLSARDGDRRDTSRHCRCVSLVADHAISVAIQRDPACRVPTLDRCDPVRMRIGARNPFVSIGTPAADLCLYLAALVVPFQDKTGLGIGFEAGPGRGLDEDGECALGRI